MKWLNLVRSPGLSSRLQRFALCCTLLTLLSSPLAAQVQFQLVNSGSSQVPTGSSFELAVRASLGIPIAAVAFRLSATGSAGISLTGRSAAPVQENGLVYLSEIAQQPYVDGLPRDITIEDATPEVLIVMDPFPYDIVHPATNVLIETLQFEVTGTGELTVTLSDATAATTLWVRDGTHVPDITIDPASVTLTVTERRRGDVDSDGDVDLDDLLLMTHCLKESPGLPAEVYSNADWDTDGDVDCDDLFLFHAAYGAGLGQKGSSKATLDGEAAGPGHDLVRSLTQWANRLAAKRRSAAPESARNLSSDSPLSSIRGKGDGDGTPSPADQPIPKRSSSAIPNLCTPEGLTYVRVSLGEDPALPDFQYADVNQDGRIDLLDLVVARNMQDPFPFGMYPHDFEITEVMVNPASGEAQWIEIRNTNINWNEVHNDFDLYNGSDHLLDMPWIQTPPGMFIQVIFDGNAPTEYDGEYPDYTTAIVHRHWSAGDPFDASSGSCVLTLSHPSYADLTEIDSVAWGSEQGEQNNYLNTQGQPFPPGGSIGRDGYEHQTWRRFSNPTPLQANGLPAPRPYFPEPGSIVLSASTTLFQWWDVRYAYLAYRFQLADEDSFSALLEDSVVAGVAYEISPALDPGHYYWRVRAEAGEFVSPWSATTSFEVEAFPPELWPSKSRTKTQTAGQLAGSADVIVLGLVGSVRQPRKDTEMVCLECPLDRGPHAWDKPHDTTLGCCKHDEGLYFAALIATLNNYYGGSLSLDQISHHLFKSGGATIQPEHELGHGKWYVDIRDTLSWALGGIRISYGSVGLYASDDETLEILKNRLGQGIPFVITEVEESPTMVPKILYYISEEGGETYLHFVQPRISGGSQEEVLLSKQKWSTVTGSVHELIFPSVPPGPGAPAEGGTLFVELDSDQDGLVDFDENERFATFDTERDSDSDDIDDKTEVWSYVFGKGIVKRTPDIDGDGLRAEQDPDTDNDGCLDGEEDLNGNGRFVVLSTSAETTSAGLIPGRLKEKSEGDPFWDDQYTLVGRADPSKIGFNRSCNVEMTLTDVDADPVADEYLTVTFEPAGIGTIDTNVPMTNQEGIATIRFTANNEAGRATVRVQYLRCASQGQEPEAERTLEIEIVPVDWIFAIQEETRHATAEVNSSYNVSQEYYGAAGAVSRYVPKYYQKAKGHFYHPEIDEPGKYIETIWVDKDEDYVRLYIDEQPVSGWEWVRSSPEDNPQVWEIEMMVPFDQAPSYPYPRHLKFTTTTGFQLATPLIWWKYSSHSAHRNRVLGGGPDPYWSHIRAVDNRVILKYQFFFGDGDSEGWDDDPWMWPDEIHTGVSFIPVGQVMGKNITFYEQEGRWPTEWWNTSEGTEHYYNIFFSSKNECVIVPPYDWEVYPRMYGTFPEDLYDELVEMGPPPVPPTLLDDFQFQRDYIGGELVELQKRNLTPPSYVIHMYIE